MPPDLSPKILSDIIGSIYDRALDPSRWEGTLAELKDILHSQTAVLGLTDICRSRVLISKSVGTEPCWLQEMAKHSAEITNFTHSVRARASSLDDPQLLSRDLPRSQADSSPYMQECLKPQGLVDVLQYVLMDSPTRIAAFAVARHERQGIITEREMEIGRLLLPHIRRAVIISDVLDVRTIERARMAEALDALRCGVLLTDARGAVLHANSAAARMLRNGGPFQDSGGILRARDPSAGAELSAAIAAAARDEASIGKTGIAVQLTESDVPPTFAHVLPLTGGDLRTRLRPTAVAAIFIGAPPDEEEGAQVVAATYGLTPAETRVLARLLSGRTLAETATDLGVAPTTVKTHLDSIFSKTGVSRQADLMRLGSAVVPPTRSSH